MATMALLLCAAAALQPGFHPGKGLSRLGPLHPVSSLFPSALSHTRIDDSRAPAAFGVRATASRRRSPVRMGIPWIDDLSSALAAFNVAPLGVANALRLGTVGLIPLGLTRFFGFLLNRTDTAAQAAALVGFATKADISALKADISALNASVNSRFDSDISALNASVNSRFDSVNSRFDSVNSRFDEVVAMLAPLSPTLAELGRRALVSDCAGAKLRVLSRTALADSTVVRLCLDDIDGGLKLAGERYGLAPPLVGTTLATATLRVMDRSTLTCVREWPLLTECAGELGSAHAGTVVTAFVPVASSGAGTEWELTLAGNT